MACLVDSLLILARADKGQIVLKHEPIDLSEIVTDATERLAYLAEQCLSICHLIVQEHNGSIQAESIAGKGSIFTLNLPLHLKKSPVHP